MNHDNNNKWHLVYYLCENKSSELKNNQIGLPWSSWTVFVEENALQLIEPILLLSVFTEQLLKIGNANEWYTINYLWHHCFPMYLSYRISNGNEIVEYALIRWSFLRDSYPKGTANLFKYERTIVIRLFEHWTVL